MDLCYNPSNERLHNAAEPGRVDDGKHARLSNSPFFGHAERTTRTFNPRCVASLRGAGHLRLQWLHVLFFGIVKPTFSPPAALCALAGRIKEGETIPGWAERRANARKRARCGHGRAGGALSHLAPRGLPVGARMAKLLHGSSKCAQAARPAGVIAAHSAQTIRGGGLVHFYACQRTLCRAFDVCVRFWGVVVRARGATSLVAGPRLTCAEILIDTRASQVCERRTGCDHVTSAQCL